MSSQLKEFMQRWIIVTVAVLVAAFVVPGIHYDNWKGLLTGTLLLGLLNAFLKPVLMLLSLPLVIFTLGLFTVVINAALLYIVGRLKYFHVNSFCRPLGRVYYQHRFSGAEFRHGHWQLTDRISSRQTRLTLRQNR